MYIKTFLTEYSLKNCKAVTTLIDSYKVLISSNNSDLRINQWEYQKRIGHLMHIMRCTQSDIVFTVSKLSQWCQNPAVHHHTVIDWVMKHLKETADVTIIYKRGDLIEYSDSAFDDNRCDQHLINETAFLCEEGVFIWYSWKQRTTATSITETKYINLLNTDKMTVWIQKFLYELRMHNIINKPVTVIDN